MSWTDTVDRLRRMSPGELACRSRQRVSALGERLWAELGAGSPRHGVLRELELDEGPEERSEDKAAEFKRRFEEHGPKRFFAGAARTPVLGAEAAARIVASADKILEGRFDLLGYTDLSFGEPLDWHLDPVSSKRAPRVHWSRIDPLDFEEVGDSKVVWELNRHQWMVRLGEAYRITGDETYADAFASQLGDWFRKVPKGVGLPWASSLEAAMRLVSWCWCLYLFRGSKALDPPLLLQMLDGIAAHASHVERYLSYYFSPNTHLTGEALGLLYAGVVLPELHAASKWRALGTRVLLEEIDRQVLDDGVYFEQSTCYQRYTVETYLHFLVLAERNRIFVPGEVRDKLARMIDFLLAVRRPDGSMPAIGDADGGALLPLVPRAAHDFSGVFATASAFFGRSDFAWAADLEAPEVDWLLGSEGRARLDGLEPSPPTGSPSRVFAKGGYVVLRDSYEADAHHLVFDVGPIGCPVSSGHGHADLLSVQVSAFGEPFIVDPGTFCYTSDEGFRSYFRGTAAHATVRIDGRDQAASRGPFRWDARPSARLRLFLSADKLLIAEGEHHAFCDSPAGVVHRRRVLLVRDAYWVLVDDLEGKGVHGIEARFQLAPLEAQLTPAQWTRVVGRKGSGLLMRCFGTGPVEGTIRRGSSSPREGWYSPDYGRLEPAPLVRYAMRTVLPARLVTLLLPMKDAFSEPPEVSPVLDERGWPVGLGFGDGECVRFHGSVSREGREVVPG